MHLGEAIKRPDITEAVQTHIVLEFDPENHDPVSIKTAIVVGYKKSGTLCVDKRVEIVIAKDDFLDALTKDQIKALKDFQGAVLKYGLKKV